MHLLSLKFPLIKPKDDILKILADTLKRKKTVLRNGNIIVVASKILALSENRLVDLRKVTPSRKAKILARKYSMNPAFCEVIIREADKIIGGVSKAILTLKDDILIANGGVDQSNAPRKFVILWPKNSCAWADKIRKYIKQKFRVNVGVIVRDSNCHPLRRGTFGVALAITGFEGVRDVRGKLDLYGRKISITQENVADNLSSAATLIMGETVEKVPIVVIKNAPVRLSSRSSKYLTRQLIMPRKECLFYEKNY